MGFSTAGKRLAGWSGVVGLRWNVTYSQWGAALCEITLRKVCLGLLVVQHSACEHGFQRWPLVVWPCAILPGCTGVRPRVFLALGYILCQLYAPVGVAKNSVDFFFSHMRSLRVCVWGTLVWFCATCCKVSLQQWCALELLIAFPFDGHGCVIIIGGLKVSGVRVLIGLMKGTLLWDLVFLAGVVSAISRGVGPRFSVGAWGRLSEWLTSWKMVCYG